MTDPIDAPATSSTGDTRRMVDLAAAVSGGAVSAGHGAERGAGSLLESRVATMSDDMLLDELRRNARVSSRRIRADFVEVHTPTKVLGYVSGQRGSFIALRGDDPAWAEEIGRYPSEALAIEALRMRRA